MIIWTQQDNYLLGTSDKQEFIIKVDNKIEIERLPDKPLVTREVKTTQYILYLKNGNECAKICAKNKLYDAKLIAKNVLEKINASS